MKRIALATLIALASAGAFAATDIGAVAVAANPDMTNTNDQEVRGAAVLAADEYVPDMGARVTIPAQEPVEDLGAELDKGYPTGPIE